MTAGLPLLLAAALSLTGAGQVPVSEPVDVAVPQAVAGGWWTLPQDASLAAHAAGPEIHGVPPGEWRVDQFDLRNGLWTWSGMFSHRQPATRLPEDERNESAAILVRDPRIRHRYGWAEYRHSQREPVQASGAPLRP